MTNNEAKFLLHAYRPSGRDAGDTALDAALAQARTDPALGAWFAREQAHAAAIAARLREIAPPAGLREAILAGGRATERARTPSQRWFPGWLGLAAAIAVLVGMTFAFWPRSAVAADTLTAFAMEDVVHGRHGGHGVPEKALQAQLAATGVHLATGLPVDFTQLEQTGCRTLHVAGHEVLEICFVRQGTEFHCYIGRASEFVSAGDAAQFVEHTGLAAASWTRGALRFVVVGDSGLDAVKRLL